MPAIVYDTGALLAAERRNPDFVALHDELTSARIRPLVPVVVLAQAWRGGPPHQISRVLKGCDILPGDERTGRAAGVACAAAGTADVVDAIVIVTAVRHQAPIVTSDPGDLTRIADSIGVKIRLFRTCREFLRRLVTRAAERQPVRLPAVRARRAVPAGRARRRPPAPAACRHPRA